MGYTGVMARKNRQLGVVREGEFSPLGDVKTDSKNRVVLKGKTSSYYIVYCNPAGQILLDPQEMVPASEAWLFKNKQALASVRQGLKEAGEGKGRKWKSFAAHADDQID